MSPCFHRPWCWTAAVGAPAATIRRAIPMRPLWPLKPSPRPAALAAARTRLASVSPVRPNTGMAGSTPSGWVSRMVRAVVSVMATVAGSGWFLPFWMVTRAVPSGQNAMSPQVKSAASDRHRPALR